MLIKSEKQLAAVLRTSGSGTLVTGFPGAGKTTARMIAQLVGLVAEDLDRYGQTIFDKYWFVDPSAISPKVDAIFGTCDNLGHVIEQWRPRNVLFLVPDFVVQKKVLEMKAKKTTPFSKHLKKAASMSYSQYKRSIETSITHFKLLGVMYRFTVTVLHLADFGLPLEDWAGDDTKAALQARLLEQGVMIEVEKKGSKPAKVTIPSTKKPRLYNTKKANNE